MLDLEFLFADSRRFVPVKLHIPYRTIRQSHIDEAFSLPPPGLAVQFAQARKLADRLANRNRFHVRKLTADFKKHNLGILAKGTAGFSEGSQRFGGNRQVAAQGQCELRLCYRSS
jgi:hypothetical protein